MKALSLWQPWASLIADGRKKIETRSWPAPQWLLGKRIAIHATKYVDYDSCEDFGYGSAPTIPRGVVLCTATLTACIRFTQENVESLFDGIDDQERLYGDYEPGRYGWMLSNIERICPPIEIRGRQGIFDVAI